MFGQTSTFLWLGENTYLGRLQKSSAPRLILCQGIQKCLRSSPDQFTYFPGLCSSSSTFLNPFAWLVLQHPSALSSGVVASGKSCIYGFTSISGLVRCPSSVLLQLLNLPFILVLGTRTTSQHPPPCTLHLRHMADAQYMFEESVTFLWMRYLSESLSMGRGQKRKTYLVLFLRLNFQFYFQLRKVIGHSKNKMAFYIISNPSQIRLNAQEGRYSTMFWE